MARPPRKPRPTLPSGMRAPGAQGGNPRSAPMAGVPPPEPPDDDQDDPHVLPGDPQPDAPDQPDQPDQGQDAGPALGPAKPAAASPGSDSALSVTEEEDGGAVVQFGRSRVTKAASPFAGWWEDLSEDMEEGDLSALAHDLIRRVEADITSRQAREERYAEGVTRTGIVEPAPGGADFTGASRVTHPLLAEVCVDYSARTVKELFPRTGPVKGSVSGSWTTEKQRRAHRKADYFNELMTNRAPEIRKSMEALTTQQPLSGEGYLKVFWDSRRRRPTTEFISMDAIILPPGVASFDTSHRFTHRQTLVRAETEERMEMGMYREVELARPETMAATTPATEANRVVTGETPQFAEEEGTDLIYEIYTDYTLEQDPKGGDRLAPYIISVHEKSSTILAIRRNWAEDDDDIRERLDTVVQFGLIPWRDGQYVGIWDLAGSLTTAATGALRALMDSALSNNSLTALRMKGSRIGGQTADPKPTQVSDIEGTAGVDDIRKLVMPFPFNPPSAVLFELMQFLLKEGRSLIQTSLESDPSDHTNVPVGTQLSRVEQAMTVYSSVFERQHQSFNQVLRIMHRLCSLYLSDQDILDQDAGEQPLRRMDFQGACDVMPTSDPSIFSDVQRYAQMQAVRQMAVSAPPGQYDLKAVDKRMLELMHVDNIEELMPAPTPPERRHAVGENAMLGMSTPIMAYPDQDHLAHLKVHLDFLTDPTMGGAAMMPPQLVIAGVAHCKQHMLMLYTAMFYHTVASQAGLDSLDSLTTSIADQKALDMALSATSDEVMQRFHAATAGVVARLNPLAMQARQLQQAMQTPQDPMSRAAQIRAQSAQQVETLRQQGRTQEAQLKAQSDQQELQAGSQEAQVDAALRQKELEAEAQLGSTKIAGEQQIAAGEAALRQAALEQEAQQQEADRAQKAQQHAADLEQSERQHAEKVQGDLEREQIEDQTALTIAGMRAQAVRREPTSDGPDDAH